MDILIVRAGNIGDVLMATPLVRVLKRHFPQSSIDFVTSTNAQCVLRGNANLRSIFIHKKQTRLLGRLSNQWISYLIKQRQYSYCFNLERDTQFKELIHASTRKECLKIGFSGSGDEFLDRVHEFSYEKPHAIQSYLNLAVEHCQVKLGADDVLMDYPKPSQTKELTSVLKGLDGAYALLHPGTTECYPNRSWRPDRFAELASYFIRRNLSVVLTAQRVHAPLVEEIIQRLPSEQRKKIFTMIDRSFDEVAQIISGANVVVCSDTGILHLTRALRVPVLGLFGPSNPQLTGTLGSGIHRMIRNDFPCGPCNYSPEYRYEDKKNCLDGAIPPCMNSITTEQACAVLEEMLL